MSTYSRIDKVSTAGRPQRQAVFSSPRQTLKALLIHAAPDDMEYPFRSHPLGGMYLTAYAEREVPGVSVDIIDLKVADHGIAGLGGIVRDMKPDVVGIGALTVHAASLHAAAAAVRGEAPEALLLAGGPHATCFPEKVLADDNIDAVVLGGGERAFKENREARTEGRQTENIHAVGTPAHLDTDERNTIDNPDDIPFPAWEKIDMPAYERHSSFTILGRRKYMSLFSSRACPYACIYCHNIFGRNYRPRSAENVLAEMRLLSERYGICDFDVLDDAFNLKRDRVETICNAIIDEKLDVRMAFPNGLRSDLLDEKLVKLMRRAGATYISFAIETASPRLQKVIHKNLKIEKAEKALRAASREGILCNGYFMLGFPTETEEELRSTIDFALHAPLDIAHFLRVTPFEGTSLYEMLDESTKQTLQQHPEYLCYEDRHLNLSKVPTKRFKFLFKYALVRFYINPFRILGILRHHPDWKSMLQYVPIALKRIFVKG